MEIDAISIITGYISNMMGTVNDVAFAVGGQNAPLVMFGIFLLLAWMMKERMSGWLIIVVLAIALTLLGTGTFTL